MLTEDLTTVESMDIGGLNQPSLYSIWADWIANLGVKKRAYYQVTLRFARK